MSWDDQELQRLLGRYRLALHNVILGLRRWGCFQIVNHGVPQEVVNSLSTAVRTFFAKSSQVCILCVRASTLGESLTPS